MSRMGERPCGFLMAATGCPAVAAEDRSAVTRLACVMRFSVNLLKAELSPVERLIRFLSVFQVLKFLIQLLETVKEGL